MRIFIQRTEDGLFLNGVSKWGPRAEAYDFMTVAAALGLCVARRLPKVRIFFDTGDSKHDWFVDISGAEAKGLIEKIARRKLQLEEHILKALAERANRGADKEPKKRFLFRQKGVAEEGQGGKD